MSVLTFTAPRLSGTSIQYSPFIDNRLALGASANFGIVGNGKVFCLEIKNDGQIVAISSFDTQDSVFSVAWSEVHENHLCVACGNGSVQLFDFQRANHPLLIMKEHSNVVSSVNWSGVDKSQFCSCSWDGSIKLWSVEVPNKSLSTLSTGQGVIYQAKFSSHAPHTIASASADGAARITDTRSGQVSAVFPGHSGSGECLTVDWNKYRPHIIASAGSDGIVRIWDRRNPNTALVNELRGHQLAIKSLKWSPHTPQHLMSVSYDMTAKVWIDNQARVVPGLGPRGLLNDFRQHTEFVTDCDWSLWGQPGWVATTGYDSKALVWKAY